MKKEKIIMIQIICSMLILISVLSYLVMIDRLKQNKQVDKILSKSSQITFSCYLLSFAVFFLYTLTSGLTVKKVITSIFIQVTVVCLAQLLSVLYCKRKLNR